MLAPCQHPEAPFAHPPLCLGISACLLGDPVRYDGGHKNNPLFSGPWAEEIHFLPFCPEAECGLGIPREPMRLEGEPDRPTLRTLHSKMDHTNRLQQWCQPRIRQHREEGVAGYLLKSRSPSCGLTVAVTTQEGATVPGMGLFPRLLLAATPSPPMAEGDLIQDAGALSSFLQRVRAYRETLS
ncbi:MAG: DUF523 domain-containing protein [Magnetococcus sp. XQGC-1]